MEHFDLKSDAVRSLTEFVRDELLAGREIEPHSSLLADGAVDSVGMVRLAAFLSDEFGVSVPPEDFIIENFRSIETVSNYVNSRLSDR